MIATATMPGPNGIDSAAFGQLDGNGGVRFDQWPKQQAAHAVQLERFFKDGATADSLAGFVRDTAGNMFVV